VPLVGVMKPSRISKVVVLPAPFGPSTANSCPSGTSKLTQSTAARSPKRFVNPTTSTALIARSCSLSRRRRCRAAPN
jgi:hypothetical protein